MSCIEDYKADLIKAIKRVSVVSIDTMNYMLRRACRARNTVFIFGNGGSATTASHLMCDFQKGLFESTGKQFRVICLNDSVCTMSAWANDTDYSEVFANQIRAFARPNDIVIAISGSGNSPSIIKAVEAADKLECITWGWTGGTGGELVKAAQNSIIVKSDNMQIIQDVHLSIGHMIYIDLIKEKESET